MPPAEIMDEYIQEDVQKINNLFSEKLTNRLEKLFNQIITPSKISALVRAYNNYIKYNS